jgi:phosphoglycolate phosphatase
MVLCTNIKVIAFDLDGTLVNSAPGLALAVDNTLREFGFSAAGVERVSTWIGNGVEILLQRAFAWAKGDTLDARQKNQALIQFNHYYSHSMIAGTTLYPTVQSTLQQLQNRGIPIAIVTNKPKIFVQPIVTYLGIDEYVSLIIGGDEVTNKKPDPAMILQVLAHFDLQKSELLLVGDSKNDIQAARRAGIPCIGMEYGYNYGKPIAEENPDQVLRSLEQLLPLLGR